MSANGAQEDSPGQRPGKIVKIINSLSLWERVRVREALYRRNTEISLRLTRLDIRWWATLRFEPTLQGFEPTLQVVESGWSG